MFFPVRFLQGVDAHRLATAWRVDEAVVAQVDGNMVDPAALELEEDQVTGLEVLALDFLAMTGGHGVGGARQIEGGVVEGVFHQPAAIEPFTWATAAPTIRCAKYIHGATQHVAARFGRHRRDQLAVGRAHALDAWLVLAQGSRNMGFRGIAVDVGKALLTIGGVGGQWQ
ncbi:hypothetical protein D3C76_1360440 [compost metagenome]